MVCTALHTHISNQAIFSKQILIKTPTELQFVERCVFMKDINTQNLWTFELGAQQGINVPIWIIEDFQQNDRQDNQNLKNDIFSRPPLASSQCLIST